MKYSSLRFCYLFYVLCGSISCFNFSAFSQRHPEKDILILKEIVCTLSHDSMQGRAAGSDGEEKAKTYLIRYFASTEIAGLNQEYRHSFTFQKDSITRDTATNIAAFINNHADSTIMLGAHYDHIGLGGAKSRSFTNKKIHPGADDNASGTALLLLLSEKLKQNNYRKYNYLFIAFSAHENGLFGSRVFVDEKNFDLSKVKMFLNFDMVGRLDTIQPIVKAIRNDSDSAFDFVLSFIKPEKFQLKITSGNFQHTDAYAFSKKNVPSITFSTGIHDDYHKTSDSPGKINYNGIYLISAFVRDFIGAFNK